jgi:5-(carboxyamino)imidazole ribonucleotide mutase
MMSRVRGEPTFCGLHHHRAAGNFKRSVAPSLNLRLPRREAGRLVTQSLYALAKGAKAEGFKVVIAGADGAAHPPGTTAALTSLPVFGVPVESKASSGQDSLYSVVQMPPGVPVGTLAIGKASAINAALLAASVRSLRDPALGGRLEAWRERKTAAVAEEPKDINKDSGA